MNIIDLSKEIHPKMDRYPGDPKVEIEVIHTIKKMGWEVRKITMGTHTGTHVDSFSHMHPNKKSIDQIPLEKFIGEAVVIDQQSKWPKQVGLFFVESAGEKLLHQILDANPKFVGGNITQRLEYQLLKHDIVTFTDLINLDLLPKNQKFIFIGLPLKIKNGDGSPIRAIAIV